MNKNNVLKWLIFGVNHNYLLEFNIEEKILLKSKSGYFSNQKASSKNKCLVNENIEILFSRVGKKILI